ncbi:MAG: tRNA (N6-threonylcarbamoyladenosine(37)-N6)-methyltransferase TrmO [Ruminococcaceae bacterium]|nr:tRNA (N6-threonylcarbamoyladenosine(37)-N6)-methyltransferase TrmO [Oscillospiraceae bacterium]
MKIIARIYNDFTDKFGIPRQSGLAESLVSKIVFEKEYRDPSALKGIEDFSHLWLIWNFSEVNNEKWSPTVRPPRLGGNKRIGVFATRSPFRPNPIGLSCVKIIETQITANEGTVIHVSGADILSGTPIYDIKPYIPYSDCIINAKGSYTDETKDYKLDVKCNDTLLEKIPQEKQKAFIDILSCDPRPSYHKDKNRIYGLDFAGFNIKFTVDENVLFVKEINELD